MRITVQVSEFLGEGAERLKVLGDSDDLDVIVPSLHRPKPPPPPWGISILRPESEIPRQLLETFLEETDASEPVPVLVEVTEGILELTDLEGVIKQAREAGRDMTVVVESTDLPNVDG